MENQKIHVTNWREASGAGESVVFVHGSAQGNSAGGDRHFSEQSSLSMRGWNLIVPDRPGHGRSPDPGRPDDAEADAVWVADLLGDGAHLVGHSFGGCVALLAALNKPQAVRSLTLIEPAMQMLAIDDPYVQAFAKDMMKVLDAPTSEDSATGFIRLVNIPSEIRGSTSAADLKRMGSGIRQLKLPAPDRLRAALSMVSGSDVPLLVVTGGWSPAFEVVGDRVAALGGGERLIVRSEHHLPQLMARDFNDALVSFFSRASNRG